MSNIVFCGDSFSALDLTGNVEWNWMNTVARQLNMDPIILGIVGCSNFVINLQVEHALKHHDFNTIIVCLTGTDRIEKQIHEAAGLCEAHTFKYAIDEVTTEHSPYKGIDGWSFGPNWYESYSILKWMEKHDLEDAIPFLYSKGLNTKRNQIYVDSMISMLEKKRRFYSNVKFYVVRNIFPWWKADDKSSYEKYLSNPSFLNTGPVEHFVEKGLHSSHLTEEASKSWSDELLEIIKNDKWSR